MHVGIANTYASRTRGSFVLIIIRSYSITNSHVIISQPTAMHSDLQTTNCMINHLYKLHIVVLAKTWLKEKRRPSFKGKVICIHLYSIVCLSQLGVGQMTYAAYLSSPVFRTLELNARCRCDDNCLSNSAIPVAMLQLAKQNKLPKRSR